MGFAVLNPSYDGGEIAVTSVDQQKIRRTRTGLIAHDPALAHPGKERDGGIAVIA